MEYRPCRSTNRTVAVVAVSLRAAFAFEVITSKQMFDKVKNVIYFL
jgi:hypothetical protein